MLLYVIVNSQSAYIIHTVIFLSVTISILKQIFLFDFKINLYCPKFFSSFSDHSFVICKRHINHLKISYAKIEYFIKSVPQSLPSNSFSSPHYLPPFVHVVLYSIYLVSSVLPPCTVRSPTRVYVVS